LHTLDDFGILSGNIDHHQSFPANAPKNNLPVNIGSTFEP
jgi:hypothetical protein